jgi:hypothetical protein
VILLPYVRSTIMIMFAALRVLVNNRNMKAAEIAFLVLLAPFILGFTVCWLIGFVCNALLLFHRCRRISAGELGWNPFLWNRAFTYDAYEFELQKRMKRSLVLGLLCWLGIALVMAIFAFTGLVKTAPAAKPVAPTKTAPQKPPRVLAKPPRGNESSNTVLK